MSDTTCPACGAVLPAAGADCPHCLLRLGLHLPPRDPDAEAPVAAGVRMRAAPDPAELARLFPGLEIEGEIGRGGMGIVYRARQRKLGRTVALKLLAPELSGDRDFAARFLREARVLARLRHEHVVAVHDFGETEGLCWLLMEHVDGPDLRRVLDAGRLAPEAALAIVPQICDALAAAHALGVVHRDIKPENVLMDGTGRAKIADFGLAKLIDAREGAPTLTRAEQAMGTPHYMAPEQMRGARDVDHRADIFSLGVVFYEMLTGQLPIGRFEAPSKRVAVDVRLDEIVLRALESRPERRYQSAVEVKSDVERVGSTPAVSAHTARDARPPAGRGRTVRRNALAGAIGALVLAAPFAAGPLWSMEAPGLALFLAGGIAAGVLAWRLDLLSSPADPLAPREARWRRIDRLGGALLLACIGLALCGAAVIASWERGTTHATPLRRAERVWSADEERALLRRLATWSSGALPDLGEPSTLHVRAEWSPLDRSPWWLAGGAAIAMLAASALLLRGRSHASGAQRLRSLVGVPFACILPVISTALWYELPILDPSPRTSDEVVGSADLTGTAEAAMDALVAAARERGYRLVEWRHTLLRERSALAPIATRVRARLRPGSLFARWDLGSGTPRRPLPELAFDALCELHEPRTSFHWSAGLLQVDAPEEAAWRAEVDTLVEEAQGVLESR